MTIQILDQDRVREPSRRRAPAAPRSPAGAAPAPPADVPPPIPNGSPVPLGERIRDLRWSRGLTQLEVAHAAGISGGYLSLIEMGKRHPAREVIAAVAHALGTSVSYLATGIDHAIIAELTALLGEAETDRGAGHAATAVGRYRRLLARPELAELPSLWRSAALGHALALEETGAAADAVTELQRIRPAAEPGAEFTIRVATALCRCLTKCGDTVAAIRLAEETFPYVGPCRPWNPAGVEFVAEAVRAYLEQGDRLAARHFAEALSDAAHDLDDVRARVIAATAALAVTEARGAIGEALRPAEEVAALAVRQNDPLVAAHAQLACAQIMLAAGTSATAERARVLFDLASDGLPDGAAFTADRARCLTGRGRAELRLDRPRAAMEPVSEAITALNGGSPCVLADAYVVLAEVFRRLDRRSAAVASLTTAHALLRNVPARRRTAQVWLAAAEAWAGVGETDRHAAALRRAMDCMGL